MTDSNPFVPPTGAPARASAAAPPPASAPALPPPTGAPYPDQPTATALAPAPDAPQRRWLAPVILVSAMLALALVLGAFAVLFQAAGTILTYSPVSNAEEGSEPEDFVSTPNEPLLDGDPGRPVAAEPLDCQECFDLEDAQSLVLEDAAYAELGVPASDGQSGSAKVYSEQLYGIRWWREDGGSPENCYLTYPVAPLPVVAEPVPTAVRLEDLHFPEWHDDGTGEHVLSEVVRLFGSSDAAVAHLADVAAARDACPGYTMTTLNYSAIVTAAPALDLPPSVAAAGWVEESGTWRTYVFDVQRGNLVARVMLTTTGGGPGEAAFRDLVEGYAVLLAGLDPSIPG